RLEKLGEAIAEKRPGLLNRNKVIFHHQIVQKKLCKFGWEILSHPLYSPNIAPSKQKI
ncbi:hypothetical protein WH47_00650, partial [Habropoda laboriosa]